MGAEAGDAAVLSTVGHCKNFGLYSQGNTWDALYREDIIWHTDGATSDCCFDFNGSIINTSAFNRVHIFGTCCMGNCINAMTVLI